MRIARGAEAILRAFALQYQETREDFPWGERVVKVRNKIFVTLHGDSRELGMTVKLPSSAGIALGLPFVTPMGYGLGKSGWVTARFPRRKPPPLGMLMQWIDESYRAVAPRRLHPAMDGEVPKGRATKRKRRD